MARTETRHLIEIVFLPDSLNLPFFLPVSIVLVPVWLVSFAIVALAVLRAFVVWPLERVRKKVCKFPVLSILCCIT